MSVKGKQQQKPVEFRIHQIKKLSFNEIDPSLLMIKRKIPESQIDLNFGIKLNPKEELLAIFMKADFYYDHLNEKKLLFGISTEYIYKISDMESAFQIVDESTFNIPDQLLYTLLHMTIAGTRGMIAALVTNEAYKHLLLPPLDTGEILQGIKNAKAPIVETK